MKSVSNYLSIAAVCGAFVLGTLLNVHTRVHAAKPTNYVADVVLPPTGRGVADEPENIRKTIQAAIDKRVVEGWELQTVTVHFDNYNTFQGPEYLLVFRK